MVLKVLVKERLSCGDCLAMSFGLGKRILHCGTTACPAAVQEDRKS